MARRIFLLAFLLAAAAAAGLPALGNMEVNSKDTLVMTQTTVNNEAWAFDLDSTGYHADNKPAADFSQNPENKAELFRILHTNDKADGAAVEGSFEFVHATNPTIRRPFSIEIWEVEATYGWSWTSFGNAYSFAAADAALATLGAGGQTFQMKQATWDGASCQKYYQYQAALVMGPWAGPKEPGDYYADLTVRIGGVETPIRIKGYYGEDFAPPTTVSNFNIMEGADTHNIDLAKCYDVDKDKRFEIALVGFLATGSQQVASTDPPTPVEAGKYSIWISPAADPAAATAGEPSPYHFILERSEGATRSAINTVWYDFDFSGDTTPTPPFALRPGSWVYEKKVPVIETSRKKASFFESMDTCYCNWSLNSLPVSIVPRFQSGQNPERMAQGNYHSDIWFILVSNQ